jgi:hypothetical protein
MPFKQSGPPAWLTAQPFERDRTLLKKPELQTTLETSGLPKTDVFPGCSQ